MRALLLQQVTGYLKPRQVLTTVGAGFITLLKNGVNNSVFFESNKRAFNNLKKLGVLNIEQINKRTHDRTNYYSINYEHAVIR